VESESDCTLPVVRPTDERYYSDVTSHVSTAPFSFIFFSLSACATIWDQSICSFPCSLIHLVRPSLPSVHPPHAPFSPPPISVYETRPFFPSLHICIFFLSFARISSLYTILNRFSLSFYRSPTLVPASSVHLNCLQTKSKNLFPPLLFYTCF